MNNILLINGANLNLLGIRDRKHYGDLTLKEIEELTSNEANIFNYALLAFQSNHEGVIIDTLQSYSPICDGIIINPGAFAHYSYALHDGLVDTHLPVVEVHLSVLKNRENWRNKSVTGPACIKVIDGKMENGYIEALHVLMEHIKHDRQ